MNRKCLMFSLWLALAPAWAVTTSDNASNAPVSKAATPAPAAQAASGVAPKGSKDVGKTGTGAKAAQPTLTKP